MNLGIQKKGKRKFLLHAVHCPPAGKVDEFAKILDHIMFNTLAEFGGDTFLMGEVNIDYGRPKHVQIKKLNVVVNKLYMSQLIN